MSAPHQPGAGLEVESVTVRFDGRAALCDVSLSVAAGSIVALLGPSGSGKSTLLRVIAGLQIPDAGVVRWQGADLTSVAAHRRPFGMVFQDGALFPHLDVAGNIGFGLRVRRQRHRGARVGELLELVGLAGFEGRDVTTLSGGERQRVALARSLAPEPAMLLLDEPLAAVDHDRRVALADDLRTVLRSTGTTAVHVTHDRDEARRVADRVEQLEGLGGPTARLPTVGSAPIDVVDLTAEETRPLRRMVLRNGDMNADVDFPEDDREGGFHLGVRLDGELVGTSSWSPQPWADAPGEPAFQLRGMAVAEGLQGQGIGRALVNAGLDRARRAGATRAWANARDSALDFYVSTGAEVIGDQFLTAATGLPHHRIVWIL